MNSFAEKTGMSFMFLFPDKVESWGSEAHLAIAFPGFLSPNRTPMWQHVPDALLTNILKSSHLVLPQAFWGEHHYLSLSFSESFIS